MPDQPAAQRFRKRPVVIEAMQWLPLDTQASEAAIRWMRENGAGWYVGEDSGDLIIESLEGPHVCVPGAWIVRGVQGEFYSIKADIFEETYEPADNAAAAQREELRSMLVEADSFISHMHHRRSWPGDSYEVERLIGRLRSTAKSLEPFVACGEQFEWRKGDMLYTTTCELVRGHAGAHSLVANGPEDSFVPGAAA